MFVLLFQHQLFLTPCFHLVWLPRTIAPSLFLFNQVSFHYVQHVSGIRAQHWKCNYKHNIREIRSLQIFYLEMATVSRNLLQQSGTYCLLEVNRHAAVSAISQHRLQWLWWLKYTHCWQATIILAGEAVVHHVLSVSLASSPDDDLVFTNVAGFIVM